MSTQYTDNQLKAALAKMLPTTAWYDGHLRFQARIVLDTELLHLCWMVEATLCEESGEHGEYYSQRDNYAKVLMKLNGIWLGNAWDWGDMCDSDLFQAAHATWQQRVIALAKVKNIDIE